MRLFWCIMCNESSEPYMRCILTASLLQNLYGQCNLLTLLIWENQDPCGSYYMTNICYERPSGTALTCSKICKLQHIEICRHNVALQFAIMGAFIIFEAGSNDPSRIISEASNYGRSIWAKRRGTRGGWGGRVTKTFCCASFCSLTRIDDDPDCVCRKRWSRAGRRH